MQLPQCLFGYFLRGRFQRNLCLVVRVEQVRVGAEGDLRMVGDQGVQALRNLGLAEVNEALEEKEPLRRELPEDVNADGLEAVLQEMRDPREDVHVPVDG